ncbi:arsenate-mycothiol transferase ArsC [Arthrobacter sp. H41]|uniref:arsenate-mycothiol transferase ArsC n=1 Tax=Arthrobacter sp. H41 TaxID=1312978 RepID=UPI00047DF4A3|nr:low molecular weight phosphatase family protein [Arthrobacter sp. H41]
MSYKAAKPAVLFVCAKNGGKSQMAAGLLRRAAGESVTVASAGTTPGVALNRLSAESLAEIGVDISGEFPKAVTVEAQQAADVVVVLGAEAQLDELEGTRYERWETDEPSSRGIEGLERMRLVRDDIDQRVRVLHRQLMDQAGESGPVSL